MGHLAELDPPQIAHACPSLALGISTRERGSLSPRKRPIADRGFPRKFRMEDPLLDGLESIRTGPGPGPIEKRTTLIPWAVAEAVCEEVSVWLDEPLPRAWIPALAKRADAIFEHCPQFRRLILGKGTAGRNWLWVFMRHWLAGILWRHRPELSARLPNSYASGHPLPPKEDALSPQAPGTPHAQTGSLRPGHR